MNKKLKIGIAGATGYVGLELVRILVNHPFFKIERLLSQSFEGKKFSDIYPAFNGLTDIVCSGLDYDDLAENCDIVITALPHGVSSHVVPLLLNNGMRVLDHSGDFRYKNVSAYKQAYKLDHPYPELLKHAVYGLPEIFRDEIKSANLVANPGCYPTCSILGIKPLLENSLIDPAGIIINAASGISGAGRKSDLAYSFCESDSAFRPYSPVGHRHTSEIEEVLSLIAKSQINISFTPHLLPVKRGMLATIYAPLRKTMTTADLNQLYKKYYSDEFFVRVLATGVCPDIRNVAYSNFADIGIFADERNNRVVIFSAIDNLGKGAALQAIQSLNIMAGLPEETSLLGVGGGI